MARKKKKKIDPIDPKVEEIIRSMGLGAPGVVSSIKTEKVMFSVDTCHKGLRVIYSDGFVDALNGRGTEAV